MSRMINADALDEILKDAQAECKKKGGNFRFGVLSNVRENLRKMPTVDAVPVVRCRDCKYHQEKSCEVMIGVYEPDWFCADGERKEEHDATKG